MPQVPIPSSNAISFPIRVILDIASGPLPINVAPFKGCLTFPFVFLSITRPRKVVVKYEDENGDLKEGSLDGMISRVFQHEYDHMLGKTFVDGVSKLKLDMAYKKAEKMMSRYKKKK